MSNLRVTFTKTQDQHRRAGYLIKEANELLKLPTKKNIKRKFLWAFNIDNTEPIERNISLIKSHPLLTVYGCYTGEYIAASLSIYDELYRFINKINVGDTVTADSQLYGLIK